MRIGEVAVSASVGILGVASAVLMIIAEFTKLTPDDTEVSRTRCVYPANPVFELALCALLLLVVALIIASAAGDCCGCCRPRTGASKTKRVMGIVASVLSWVAALIAGALYLPGAPLNAPVSRNVVADGRYYLVATALGITSYIMLTSTPAQIPAPAAAPTTAATGTEPKLGCPGLRANALSAPHERVWSTTEPVGEHTGAGVDDTTPMLTVEMVRLSPGIRP